MATGRRLPKGNEPSLATKFGSAGMAACIADLATFPLDTAKVRLQIQGETGSKPAPGRQIVLARQAVKSSLKYKGITGTVLTITKEEGARALYNGLCPGLQRQLCFASIRIGLYDSVKQFYMDVFDADGTTPASNVGLRILAGITTGAVAISCAQPTDVVKVRMQAASRGTGAVRYNGTIHAYKTIATQEGVRGLWKGLFPNVTRNAIVNAAELVSYDLIKEAILKHNLLSDSMPCHFISAFCAGFCATCIASPVDVVKTRFMNSPDGVYSGALQCAKVMFKTNGITSFYKGFVPSFMRLGSWNVVMFVCYEQIKRGVTGYLHRDTTKTATGNTLTQARTQHM